MAILAAPLTGALLRVVSPPIGYGAAVFVVLILIVQSVVAVLGGYIGYACVEGRQLRISNPGAIRGKLAVIVLLALGVAAVAGIAAGV